MRIEQYGFDPNSKYVNGKWFSVIQTSLQIVDLHWTVVQPGWTYPDHTHLRLFEYIWVNAGCKEVTVKQRKYRLHPGDVLFLGPDQQHRCEASGQDLLEMVCFHFSIDDPLVIQRLSRLQPYIPKADADKWGLSSLAARLCELAKSVEQGTSSALSIQSIVFGLLGQLSAAAPDSPLQQVNLDHVRLARRIAGEIETFSRRRLHEAFPSQTHNTTPLADSIAIKTDGSKIADIPVSVEDSISEISKRFGISQSYCNRIFRSVYGIGPRQFLSDIKLREAKFLLTQPGLTLEHIADLLGYRDAVTFSRQFKRWTGYSPRGYQARKRKNEEQ